MYINPDGYEVAQFGNVFSSKVKSVSNNKVLCIISMKTSQSPDVIPY